MRFKKKPVEIEAVKVPNNEYADDPMTGWHETPDWLQKGFDDGVIKPVFKGEDYWYYEIQTLEGTMLASPDDWIIQGIKGELYPCRNDIFRGSYDLVIL